MKKLVVLLGPTAVGKTELSLKLAEHYASPILSVDSRQVYKEIEIGTAAPTNEQRQRVEHHFVGILNIDEYYSVSDYEHAVLFKLDELYQTHNVVIATGGSMMYVDALCYGIDPMPNIDPTLREQLYNQYQKEGLENILSQLKLLDPVHYSRVDHKNYKRIIHALEVCLQTGQPYSSFLTYSKKQRPFELIRIGLERDRGELYDRINNRVDQMVIDGILDEAKKFHSRKELNALNTVGYKELFKYLDGEWTLGFAIEKIKQSTRTYAKQQMRWFKKDNNTQWFNLTNSHKEDILQEIIKIINNI